jgi:protein-S-isoprenylcysteine O-methyltransferase Ste14
MPLFPKPYADVVQRLRVPIGLVAAAGFGWFAHPTARSLLLGLPPAVAGLALRAWAAGHLRKNLRLTTSGPYAWVRNPLYLGTLLALIGCLAGAAEPTLTGATLIAFVLIYPQGVELEEQHLRELFLNYAQYAARVPQFIPRPPRERGTARFEWAVYRRNKEYKALFGFLWAYAFLLGKALYSSLH